MGTGGSSPLLPPDHACLFSVLLRLTFTPHSLRTQVRASFVVQSSLSDEKNLRISYLLFPLKLKQRFNSLPIFLSLSVLD